MSQTDIDKMDFKQLRNEVQLLRDELAVFKRKYEDIIYNLDDDNFSSRIVREKGEMRTAIKQTEEEISLQAEKITETEEAMAELTVKAGEISSIAKTNITAFFESSVAPTKANTSNNQKKMLCLFNGAYYYYNDITGEWKEYPKDGLQTMFVQNGEGFALQGNVLIDGDTVITKNLKLSGNVTWDMSNSPVQTRYSSNGTSWHSPMVSGDIYMQMSFDGGKNWSTSTKVVGTDGRDGYDGSDANVTPQNVFNALTNSGANQGIFAAFVNKQNKIYINAEYLATKIADVDDIIYLGNMNDNNSKQIVFANGAKIFTYVDETGYPPTGLKISATTFNMELSPDDIWVGDTNKYTLADYVAQNGGGGGTAKFA